jgi:hypothetical protein
MTRSQAFRQCSVQSPGACIWALCPPNTKQRTTLDTRILYITTARLKMGWEAGGGRRACWHACACEGGNVCARVRVCVCDGSLAVLYLRPRGNHDHARAPTTRCRATRGQPTHCFDKLVGTPRPSPMVQLRGAAGSKLPPLAACLRRENEPANEHEVDDVEEVADFFCQSHVCHNEDEDLSIQRKRHAIAKFQ